MDGINAIRTKPLPRDRELPLMVYVNGTERNTIKADARAAGLSVPAFLRLVGQHYVPKAILDSGLVDRLAEVNAEQTRLLYTLEDNPSATRLLAKVAELHDRLSDLIAEKRDAA